MNESKEELDRRLDDEISFHIEQQVAKNLRAGMTPDEARRSAALKFGGVESAREYTRDQYRWAAFHEFGRDVRIALRMWKRTRGAALVAVLTLALGIGANTAMFSVLHAIILNPLPYPEIDRVVSIWDASERSPHNEVAFANYVDWKARQKSFESIGLYRWWTANITGDQAPERVQGFQFAGETLQVLGLRPYLGRWFTPEENAPAGDRVALLSYGLWQRRYGGDPAVVGRTIVLNDVPRQVIGVMPPEMNFPRGAEVLTPLRVTPEIATNRKSHGSYVLARLKQGVTLADANADIAAITSSLAQTYPDTNKGLSARVYPLAADIAAPYRGGVWLLMASVGFVLLIACANLANLLLAREPGRVREIAVRVSIGASRGRIIRQLIAESVALSATGGALGVALAALTVRALRNAAPADVLVSVPGLANLGVDGSVLLFTLALSVITGLVFGLLPALRASAVDTSGALRESHRSLGAASGNRLRGILVSAEIALALILLSGSGSTLRALSRLASMEIGFDSSSVITMGISLPYAKYGNDASQIRFYRSLLSSAREIPGVLTVGLTSHIPLAPSNASSGVVFEGRETSDQEPEAEYRTASAGYFETLGARIVRGRSFAETDTPTSPNVMVVNEAFARHFYPNGDALGSRVRFSGPLNENPWREIVGIVGDLRHEINQAPKPETFIPFTQGVDGTLFLVAKTRTDALGMAPALRAAVTSIDPNQPVWEVRTLDEIKARSMTTFRAMVAFISAFGAVALFLSAVGIFGVVSFLVSARTQEIGLRMALGARASDVVRLIVAQSSVALGIGFVAGAIGAVGVGRVLTGAFPEMSSADPASLAITGLVLATVAAISTWLPARRAAAVAPSEALRAE